MRIHVAIAALLGTATACASNPAPVSTSPLAQCPFNVVATVRNPLNRTYDIYYQDGRRRTMLGEIAAGSTTTYTLPGEGRGYISVFAAKADGGGRARTDRMGGVQIRMHCAGS